MGLIQFQFELEIGSGVRKAGEQGEKTSEQGREPTKNTTQKRRRVRDLKPGLLVGSELSHQCAIRAPLNIYMRFPNSLTSLYLIKDH